MNKLNQVYSSVVAALLLVVGWLHELIKPIGEWISGSLLSSFEEVTRVRKQGEAALGSASDRSKKVLPLAPIIKFFLPLCVCRVL